MTSFYFRKFFWGWQGLVFIFSSDNAESCQSNAESFYKVRWDGERKRTTFSALCKHKLWEDKTERRTSHHCIDRNLSVSFIHGSLYAFELHLLPSGGQVVLLSKFPWTHRRGQDRCSAAAERLCSIRLKCWVSHCVPECYARAWRWVWLS